MTENMNKEHVGSSFDDFLAKDNSLERCTTVAKKRVDECENEKEKVDRLTEKTKK